MKTKKKNRILRRTKQEFVKLMEGYVPPSYVYQYAPVKFDEKFEEFSLFEKYKGTYTDINTVYIP